MCHRKLWLKWVNPDYLKKEFAYEVVGSQELRTHRVKKDFIALQIKQIRYPDGNTQVNMECNWGEVRTVDQE